MERLDNQVLENAISVYRTVSEIIEDITDHDYNPALDKVTLLLLEELKAYRDAKEHGLLLRLPCRVGDKIYKVWYKPCHHGEDHPDSYGCCGCYDDCDLERTIFEFIVPSLDWILGHFNTFGEHVWFLTREEAEAALERMK